MLAIQILDYIGVFVFAVSGVSAAASKKLDLFGGVIIAFVTALGGGTVRDVLIDAPIAWMENTEYVYIALGGSLFAFTFRDTVKKIRKSLFLFDSIGIGLFTIIGLQKAIGFGFSYDIAIILGVITATFGGVIRDILCNDIPLIFRKEIYATACIAGAVIYSIGDYFQLQTELNILISCLTVTGIRTWAVYKKVSMPVINDRL
ncbi:trimeric intracellular cation channel family protein [Parvicella tangerina]|uniref:Glycine transporter domain-containing protein n=1 Tax=Parvicella tangerina TaxID=2829795 RepID=A0A916JQN2_9FLAO|nr:trimeric intracellular cation channel family protein [Parvicella tangerina]CAG5087551.1 hypothetical protein CRYO30217_03511 [Parvicella tangerina]